jgi:hypothetical protein
MATAMETWQLCYNVAWQWFPFGVVGPLSSRLCLIKYIIFQKMIIAHLVKKKTRFLWNPSIEILHFKIELHSLYSSQDIISVKETDMKRYSSVYI